MGNGGKTPESTPSLNLKRGVKTAKDHMTPEKQAIAFGCFNFQVKNWTIDEISNVYHISGRTVDRYLQNWQRLSHQHLQESKSPMRLQ